MSRTPSPTALQRPHTIAWGTVLAGALAVGLAVLVVLTEIAGFSIPFRSAGPGAVIVVGVLILLAGLVIVLRSNRATHAPATPATPDTPASPATPTSRPETPDQRPAPTASTRGTGTPPPPPPSAAAVDRGGPGSALDVPAEESPADPDVQSSH